MSSKRQIGRARVFHLQNHGLITTENDFPAVKVCRAYEQSTKQVKEFRDNSNPSNSSTKVSKVAQKPDPRVPRNKKPDNKHAKKGNEGMKINCTFCGYQHEKSREKCPAWGKKSFHV